MILYYLQLKLIHIMITAIFYPNKSVIAKKKKKKKNTHTHARTHTHLCNRTKVRKINLLRMNLYCCTTMKTTRSLNKLLGNHWSKEYKCCVSVVLVLCFKQHVYKHTVKHLITWHPAWVFIHYTLTTWGSLRHCTSHTNNLVSHTYKANELLILQQ